MVLAYGHHIIIKITCSFSIKRLVFYLVYTCVFCAIRKGSFEDKNFFGIFSDDRTRGFGGEAGYAGGT
jgi:hypothetical protein